VYGVEPLKTALANPNQNVESYLRVGNPSVDEVSEVAAGELRRLNSMESTIVLLTLTGLLAVGDASFGLFLVKLVVG
jgi:hypothetical protein